MTRVFVCGDWWSVLEGEWGVSDGVTIVLSPSKETLRIRIPKTANPMLELSERIYFSHAVKPEPGSLWQAVTGSSRLGHSAGDVILVIEPVGPGHGIMCDNRNGTTEYHHAWWYGTVPSMVRVER